MSPHAEELRNAARQFQQWADMGGVTLPPSALHIYAAAMAEAAHALGLQEWHELTVQHPPKRNPHAKPGWIVAVIEGDRA